MRLKKTKLHLIKICKLVYVLLIAFLLIGCFSNSKKSEGHSFAVHFLDVGDADAIFVKCDDEYMMIDFGKKGDNTKIDIFLRDQKVEKFKYIVCTHPHDDHYGGYESVLKRKKWGTTVFCTGKDAKSDSPEYAKFIKKAGKIKIPDLKKEYSLGTAKIDFLAVNTDKKNDSSIVLMITYGDTKFLFTGDAENKTENVLIKNDIKCDVLKVAHHGKSSSTSEDFLSKCKPKYAVICASGLTNRGDVTERLQNRDITVFCTDNGRIIAESDGKKVTFTNERGDLLN